MESTTVKNNLPTRESRGVVLAFGHEGISEYTAHFYYMADPQEEGKQKMLTKAQLEDLRKENFWVVYVHNSPTITAKATYLPARRMGFTPTIYAQGKEPK